MSDKIYEMKLHERIEITPMIEVIRVPGGWIYMCYSADDLLHVFVPFDNEFQEAWEK